MADLKIPPTLDEWKSVIVNPNAPFCDEFKKIPRLMALIFQWFSYAFESDGKTPTSEFLASLTGGGGTITINTPPGQVVGVSASTGLAGYIYVSWQAVVGATLYYVYRSATNDIATATNMGSTSSLAFSEKDVAGGGTLVDGTTYYYWVKAWNNHGYGPESVVASGSCVVGSDATQHFHTSTTITVPAGMTLMTVHVWGGGGGGGFGNKVSDLAWFPVDQNPNPPGATFGGGGGGGGYATKANHSVTPGNDVTIVIGNGGSPGQQGLQTYVSYGGSAVAKASGGNPGSTHAGGIGGDVITGDSGSTGSTGIPGNSSAGGTGGSAGNSAGLPAGDISGYGGTGGIQDGTGATSGQKGYVLIEFSGP